MKLKDFAPTHTVHAEGNVFETVGFVVPGQPLVVVPVLTAMAAAEMLAALKAIAAWADREAMPMGGRNDGPWELVDAAIAKTEVGAL